MDDVCRNCDQPIVLGPPSPDEYWYHPRNQSVYCDLRYTKAGRTGSIHPSQAKRAEPKRVTA